MLHAHGRAHSASGVAKFGKVSVLNPGSLRYTHTYGTMTLVETRNYGGGTVTSTWRVVRAAIHDVDDASNDESRTPSARFLSSGKALLALLACLIACALAYLAYARRPADSGRAVAGRRPSWRRLNNAEWGLDDAAADAESSPYAARP